MSMLIHAYCDGACKGNPGPGGWGSLFFCPEDETPLVFRKFGGKSRTTNSEMELVAFLETLKLAPKGHRLEIHTDSKYVFNSMVKEISGTRRGVIRLEGKKLSYGWLRGWMENGWKKSGGGDVMYPEIWKEIIRECDAHIRAGSQLGVVWVKGHAGNEGNEMADELANLGVPRVLLEHTDPKRKNQRT